MDRSTTTPSGKATSGRPGCSSVSRSAAMQKRSATLPSVPSSASKIGTTRHAYATLSSADTKAAFAASSMKSTTTRGPAAGNQPADMAKSEKIRTFLRIKPTDNPDADGFAKGLGQVQVDSAGKTAVIMSSETRVQPSVTSAAGVPTAVMKTQEFSLDGVFDQWSTQADVYTTSTEPMIADLLTGRSFTLATYGMTGSGKTHTFWGDSSSGNLKGIVPRFFSDLFEKAQERQTTLNGACTVTMSLLELYNDSLYDLLRLASVISTFSTLKGSAREVALESAYKTSKVDMSYVSSGANVEVSVPGASTVTITSCATAIEQLQPAMSARRSAATNMNSHSSRSHAILQVRVAFTYEKDGRIHRSDSLASLVDLAGSERQKRTGAAGTNLKEAGAINHSLLTLGNVMKSLADQHRAPKSGVAKPNFKAWRDDLLTQLLHPCLDGNSRVAFIVTISPEVSDWEQSMSSLDFARRAGQITVRPVDRVAVEELESFSMLARRMNAEASLAASGGAAPSNEGHLSSPAVSKTARDIKLLASHATMLRPHFADPLAVPDTPVLQNSSPIEASTAVADVLRRLGSALAASLTEIHKIKLQVGAVGLQDSVSTFTNLLAATATPVAKPLSGSKRQRSPEPGLTGPDSQWRPLRRRMSEEAFVGEEAIADFLGNDDYAESPSNPAYAKAGAHTCSKQSGAEQRAEFAAAVAEGLDDIREDVENKVQDLLHMTALSSLAEERDALVMQVSEFHVREQQLQTANADLLAFSRSVAALAHRAATFFSAPMEVTFRDAELQLQILLRERRSHKTEIQALQSQNSMLLASIQDLTAQLKAKDAALLEVHPTEVIEASCAPAILQASGLDYDDGEIAFTRRGPPGLREPPADISGVDLSPLSDCRRSSLTSSSPHSIQSLTSLDLRPELAPTEPAGLVAEGKRQRRLVLPRGWSSHALQEEKLEHSLPPSNALAGARLFVDPFFKLPVHSQSAEGTTSPIKQQEDSTAVPNTAEHQDKDATPAYPETVLETPMDMTENVPALTDAPIKSAKKPIKKRNVLRALIQTVSTN